MIAFFSRDSPARVQSSAPVLFPPYSSPTCLSFRVFYRFICSCLSDFAVCSARLCHWLSSVFVPCLIQSLLWIKTYRYTCFTRCRHHLSALFNCPLHHLSSNSISPTLWNSVLNFSYTPSYQPFVSAVLHLLCHLHFCFTVCSSCHPCLILHPTTCFGSQMNLRNPEDITFQITGIFPLLNDNIILIHYLYTVDQLAVSS